MEPNIQFRFTTFSSFLQEFSKLNKKFKYFSGTRVRGQPVEEISKGLGQRVGSRQEIHWYWHIVISDASNLCKDKDIKSVSLPMWKEIKIKNPGAKHLSCVCGGEGCMMICGLKSWEWHGYKQTKIFIMILLSHKFKEMK